VHTRFILNNFYWDWIGGGGPRTPKIPLATPMVLLQMPYAIPDVEKAKH